ncbi:hypothetical protein Pelo_18959 [Pelomyxa schiedti]|nr:hypothetical protein Pelo_18959 [Pelomyxa schiedti]
MVSLCTRTFLLRGSSSSSSSALHGDDSSVDVECGVCSRKTAVDIGDVLYDHDLNRKQQEGHGGAGSVCSLHGGMPLAMYCVNDKKLVCARCVLESHQRHNLTLITSQHRVAGAEVSSLLKAIQRERESLEHSASCVEDSIDILTTRQQHDEWKSFIASQSAPTGEHIGIEQARSLISLTQNPIMRNWKLADKNFQLFPLWNVGDKQIHLKQEELTSALLFQTNATGRSAKTNAFDAAESKATTSRTAETHPATSNAGPTAHSVTIFDFQAIIQRNSLSS